MKGKLGAVALVAAMCMGGQAQAASCWSAVAYEAAQLRDFETLLMVQTLRCRIKDLDFSNDYNRFVREKRPILSAASDQLRGQFALDVGKGRALGAYDDFMTKVANGYGGGTVGMDCKDYARLAKMAVQAPAQRAAIVKLAESVGSSPRIPGRRCGTNVALNAGK
ncbi:MAG: hypothetical protein AB7U35_10220 [Sphingobium sp.]